ncbi:MAG TPA: DUF72 domain-containing protein [bacterium]|nr:DUF72 domain-containing protein [bacterium]
MIKIGTSGFSFPDWKGIIYPARLPPREMLYYYAGELKFDAVEINSTYYSIPKPENMEAMVKKTPDKFEFAVKAYKGMTHDPFDDRLEEQPSQEDIENYFRLFREAVEPFRESNKLGAILLQFPVFFRPSSVSRQYLLKSKEMLGDLPVVIEFRNNAWAKRETFAFMKDNGLAYCAVDEPKLPRLMPFINEVTSGIGYMRFHGRNPNWFNAPVSERYNYLYTNAELEEFIHEANKMNEFAEKTYIFFNNCHGGSAARNATTFRKMLGFDTTMTADDKLFE